MFIQGKRISRDQWLERNQKIVPNESTNNVPNFEDKIDFLKNEYEQKVIERAKRQAKIEEDKKAFEYNLENLESKLAVPLYSFDNIIDAMDRNDSKNDIKFAPVEDSLGLSLEIKEKNESSRANYHLNYDYILPDKHLLELLPASDNFSQSSIDESINRLQEVLYSFNFDGEVIDAVVGPRVTLYKIKVSTGIKVSELTRLTNDIMMGMEAVSIRILAPVPGRNYAGIEIPNTTTSIIGAREILECATWAQSRLTIPIILGKSISGENIIFDLAKAPHLLIAGATGSGKSVCLNTIILSLLYKFSPENLRMILVDPKVVEFAMYSKLPHLLTPIINDANLVG
ncbi:MAG: DNA translocase FtsK, partial [Lentisphaeria bacterium]